jgi:hypothetical protein
MHGIHQVGWRYATPLQCMCGWSAAIWFETHVLGASASVVALHDRSSACNVPLCSHVLPGTARPTRRVHVARPRHIQRWLDAAACAMHAAVCAMHAGTVS